MAPLTFAPEVQRRAQTALPASGVPRGRRRPSLTLEKIGSSGGGSAVVCSKGYVNVSYEGTLVASYDRFTEVLSFPACTQPFTFPNTPRPPARGASNTIIVQFLFCLGSICPCLREGPRGPFEPCWENSEVKFYFATAVYTGGVTTIQVMEGKHVSKH